MLTFSLIRVRQFRPKMIRELLRDFFLERPATGPRRWGRVQDRAQMRLRIEVHEERRRSAQREPCGQIEHRGRLTDPALLIEHSQPRSHSEIGMLSYWPFREIRLSHRATR